MTGGRAFRSSGRPPWPLAAAGTVFLAAIALLLASSLFRPSPPTYAPTVTAPEEVGERLVRDREVTLDARDPEAWVFFDLSRGAVVSDPGPRGWDLAARRYRLVVNGGPAFAGEAGAAEAGGTWSAVRVAPRAGYAGTEGRLGENPSHPVLDGWYRYRFLSHLLEPRPVVFALRTADGRYAKLQVRSYYCPGARPGCLTLRYTYRGDGSRYLEPGASASPTPSAASRSRATSRLVERPGSRGSSRTSPPSASTSERPTTSSGS